MNPCRRVMPAELGAHITPWIPACARMTLIRLCNDGVGCGSGGFMALYAILTHPRLGFLLSQE